MDDVCAVCTGALEAHEPVLRLPGCNHTFHVSCALNFAQYDCRCPVCRAVPTGVVRRAHQSVEDHGPTEWEDYVARRRDVLHRRPELAKLYSDVKRVQGSMIREYVLLQRAYDRGCREVWRGDPEVLARRRVASTLRRKSQRLEDRLAEELVPLLGPEPE